MSSPFTDTFNAYWEDEVTRVPIVLAKIEIAEPSAVTLYVATRGVTTPDGQTWEAGLKADSLRARVAMLDPGPSPADTTIQLANRTYSALPDARIDKQLSAHLFQGAIVTLWLWNDVRHPTTGLQRLAWADAACVYKAARADAYDSDDPGVTLKLLQDQSWNKPTPPTSIDEQRHPNAPDGTRNQPEPIIYGAHTAIPMPTPFDNDVGGGPYVRKPNQEQSGGGFGVIPMHVVDPGQGAALVKVLAAGHQCAKLYDQDNGLSLFLAMGDTLCPLVFSSVAESLGASQSYYSIDDDKLIAYYGVRPVDVRTGTNRNSAGDARRAADTLDERTFATLDQATGKLVLELTLPNAGAAGYIESVEVVMAYVGDGSNTHQIRVYPFNASTSAMGTPVANTATNTVPAMAIGTWDASYWQSNQWSFGGTTQPFDIRVDFAGGTVNKARIHWVALRVKFRPQRNLIAPGKGQTIVLRRRRIGEVPTAPEGASVSWNPKGDWKRTTYPAVPPVFDFSGAFFGHAKGYADDGSGTYTGVAGALIERPPDIARHFLTVYGGLSSGDFETGASAFGSFALARGLVRNAAPTDFKLAAWIGSKTSVQQVVQEIARQSLMCFYRDRFTGKWLAHAWRRGGAADFRRVLEKKDLPGLFQAGVNSDVSLAQGLRVAAGMDYFYNRPLFETFINAEGSSQGVTVPTARDQRLVVDSTNNKLDWSDPTTRTATLASATYTEPIELAADIQAKMRVHTAAVIVGFGHDIKAGYNDLLRVTVGGTDYTATLAAGRYSDPAALAREATARLNELAHGLVFSVAYDFGTCKFTISASGTFTLKAATGPSTKATPVMGFIADATGTSRTAEAGTYSERFWWTGADITLRVYTGANAATNCAPVIGFARIATAYPGDDPSVSAGGGRPYLYADCTRGVREAVCQQSVDRYGPRAEDPIEAPWVRDESSAQQLRDRLFDFGSTPRAWVRFRTYACPDIRRLQLISFAADVDWRRAYPGYGSDGSWAGKVFRVLEVEQALGPSFHTEVYAEEA